ncbi:MAG: hypothetical protein SFW62_02010 [Alphaproteobacteria bacterium]|nr:hypothetical protein [Alphaproteobacteria bacterium]
MKKQFLASVALAALLIAGPALAADTSAKSESSVRTHSDGGYEAKDKMENTDSSGTNIEKETTKKVDVDSEGNKKTTVHIKSKKDPKGLFNKSTTEIKNKAVEKDGKTEYSHTKKVDGKTVEQNNQMQQPAD